MTPVNPRVVILVPWREQTERRVLWDFCRPQWVEHFPDWDIYEGASPDGPFNRSAAINDAARQAGDWDVALIIDADVMVNPPSVRNAVELAAQTDRMVVAHNVRIMLTQHGTEKILKGYEGSWRRQGFVEVEYHDSVSCAVAVTRRAFDTVGGFDEKFVGWGYEDSSFLIAVEAHFGHHALIAGETWHLWHPHQPETAAKDKLRQANLARHGRYVDARGDRDALQTLIDEHLGINATQIPRVLFRTIPENPSDEAEEWWAQACALHPRWRHVTYREPVTGDEFVAGLGVGAALARCTTGAQRAGLIRLAGLITHGGVYIDSDVQLFRPLDPLLHCQAFAAWEDDIVHPHGRGTVPDAVLGAAPGLDVFSAMYDEAVRKLPEGAWESGPGVTTRNLPGRADVLLLPPGSFMGVHYLEKADMESYAADPPPWAFGLHWCRHSWGTEAEHAAIAAQQRK